MNAKMSKNFDKRLLNSMVGKQIPVDSFEEELKKIFRAKSRKNLLSISILLHPRPNPRRDYHNKRIFGRNLIHLEKSWHETGSFFVRIRNN